MNALYCIVRSLGKLSNSFLKVTQELIELLLIMYEPIISKGLSYLSCLSNKVAIILSVKQLKASLTIS